MNRAAWWTLEMLVTIAISVAILSLTSHPVTASGDEAVRSMHALESIAHSLEKCPR